MLIGRKIVLSTFLLTLGATMAMSQTPSRIQLVTQKLNLVFGEKQSSYRATNVTYTIEYPRVFDAGNENAPIPFLPDSLARKGGKDERPGNELMGARPRPEMPFFPLREKEDDKGMKLYVSVYANDIDDDLYSAIASGDGLTGNVTYMDSGKERQVAFSKARLVGVDESYVAGAPDRMLSICLLINQGSLNGHAISLNMPRRPGSPKY
ncbi:hypothetical protein [Olivibacter sitiensis]|uniref:hypothetical protein n=1 Tax=Olivibacter sitiensis TaxID=376470 RepID=UPI00146FAA5E|nr:hypothetical protein [Olivibacter sitiensis]